MRISPLLAASRQSSKSANRALGRAGLLGFPVAAEKFTAIPTTIMGKTSSSQSFQKLVESIFRSMTFKPLSMKKLQAQGLDFESAKVKMQELGIKNIEIIQVPTSEGKYVQILYAKHPEEEALTVFIPGQHGKIAKHIESGEVLQNWNTGKSICLTSFRAYMGNPGQPHHRGQAQDLSDILNYLETDKLSSADKTELIAHSMGCDTLTNALALRNKSEATYKKIVLRAPYTNIAAMIEHKIDTKIYLKPFRQFKREILAILAKLTMDAFTNLKYLKAESIRVCLSEADEKIPYTMSRAVQQELNRLNINDNVTSIIHPGSHRMRHDATCLYHKM